MAEKPKVKIVGFPLDDKAKYAELVRLSHLGLTKWAYYSTGVNYYYVKQDEKPKDK